MRAALFTSFPERFVNEKILPDLSRRGVEVLQAYALEVVLHMNELGGHSNSHILSRVARAAGVTVRALSRKKASWSFLPSPR